MKESKINTAIKLGLAFFIAGVRFLMVAFKGVKKETKAFGFIYERIKEVVDIHVTQRDTIYYCVDRKTLEKMLKVIWAFMRFFPWRRETHDCDDRAKLVSALCSFLFDINSCGEVYCKRTTISSGKKALHWVNVGITAEGDFFLFDLDARGRMEIMKKGTTIMGHYNYEFKSARF